MEYTRENLIKRCEEASVKQERWSNRDSAEAQRQVGECLMLLKAGCDFEVLKGKEHKPCSTNIHTIWIEISFKGFSWFEDGLKEDQDAFLSKHTFYLPQSTVLRKNGGDWY